MDIIMCRDGMRAVDNVSLCIPDGTLMCLLGYCAFSFFACS
jgi:ABC-type multidrug transport system ATPase subunit